MKSLSDLFKHEKDKKKLFCKNILCPCNHEELMVKDEKGRLETKRVLVRIQETATSFKRPYFADCMMSKWDGEESAGRKC